MKNTQGYLIHGLCFHKNFQPNGEDRPWPERTIMHVENKCHEKVRRRLFITRSRGQRQCPREAWLCRERVQLEGAAKRRVQWGQSPVPALCMTQESWLPSSWQHEGQSRGEQCDFSHFCAQHEAVGIELPTLNIQLRSQNLILGSGHLCSQCFSRSGHSSSSDNWIIIYY